MKRLMAWESRNPILALACAALLTRLVVALLAGPGNEDDGSYGDIARSIVEGRGYQQVGGMGLLGSDFVYRSWFPPGFAYFMAASFWLFGYSLEPMRCIFIGWSSLTAVLIARCGQMAMGSSGRLAGWLWVFYVPQIFWSTRVDSRTLAFNLFVLALWFTFRCHYKPSTIRAATAGFTWAAVCLTRSEYLALAIVSGVWLAFKAKINDV